MSEDQRRAAEEFIGGAGKPPEENPEENAEEAPGGAYPWEEERVREDVKQTYPLRLPEPLHLKLKFLAEKTGKSMNKLCNEAVSGLVEERLGEMLEEDR